MKLFIYVIADIIHLFKLMLLCDMLFRFEKRISKYKRIMLLMIFAIVSMVSVATFQTHNAFIVMILSEFTIVMLLCLMYKENLWGMIISALWITFTMSMIDTMSSALFDVTMTLFKLKYRNIDRIGFAVISLIFVFIVGKVYIQRYSEGLKTIGIRNLFLFTLLAVLDTFIVAVMSYIIKDGIPEQYRVLCMTVFILVILGIFLQLAAVILLLMQKNIYKEKKQITEKYLSEQKNHYEYLENREKETKKFRHDLRNHMQMLSNFARNHQYDDFYNYLETIEMKIESFGNIITVHNGIVDAVINQFYSKAIQNNIKMEVRGRFPEDCAIDAYDLCTIFSNVLSNALEAAIETEEKLVTVECRYTDKNIIVVVTNSFINDGNETIKTRKDDLDYHGYGLENTKDSIEKYHGVFDIETKDNLFILKILFNYIEKRDYENRNNRG